MASSEYNFNNCDIDHSPIGNSGSTFVYGGDGQHDSDVYIESSRQEESARGSTASSVAASVSGSAIWAAIARFLGIG